jgi:hypothetical protein
MAKKNINKLDIMLIFVVEMIFLIGENIPKFIYKLQSPALLLTTKLQTNLL